MFVFLAIAAAGLSVIPRYLVIPSLMLNLCVARGARRAGRGRERPAHAPRVPWASRCSSLLLVALRAPAYLNDFRKLNGQTKFVSEQHQNLKAVLEHPAWCRC